MYPRESDHAYIHACIYGIARMNYMSDNSPRPIRLLRALIDRPTNNVNLIDLRLVQTRYT